MTNMIESPDNPLFQRVLPHNHYAPVQAILNRLKPEVETEAPWQVEFYTRQITTVIESHFSFEFDLFHVSNMTVEACDSIIRSMNEEYRSENATDLDKMMQVDNLDRLLARIPQNFTYRQEQGRALVKALIKIQTALTMIEMLNEAECLLSMDQKREYKKRFSDLLNQVYDQVIPAWMRNIGRIRRGMPARVVARNHGRVEIDATREQRDRERQQQEQLADVRRYNERWDRKLLTRLKRHFSVIANLRQLLKWDRHIDHFGRNLFWSTTILSKGLLESVAVLCYWVPFKILLLPLKMARSSGWINSNQRANQINQIEDTLAKIYYKAAVGLTTSAAIYFSLGYGLFLTTGELIPLMALAPYFAIPLIAGVTLGATVVGAYVGIALCARALNTIGGFLNPRLVRWENSWRGLNQLRELNRAALQHDMMSDIPNAASISRLLSTPVRVPLHEQVIFTNEDIKRLRNEVINDRVQLPAFDRALQADREVARLGNRHSRLFPQMRFRTTDLETYENYKRKIATELSKNAVVIDESHLSEPRLR